MRHAPGIAFAVAVQLAAATALAAPPVVAEPPADATDAATDSATAPDSDADTDADSDADADADSDSGTDSDTSPDADADADSDTGPEPAASGPTPEELIFAAKVAEADKRFTEGKALMSEGRYAEAAAEFERSHASIEFGDTLFRIVEAYEAANEPIQALKKARAYLALDNCEGGKESPYNYPCAEPDQRAKAAKKANRLRQFVGELRLKIRKEVPLREVRVADEPVPLDDFPLLVLPGSYIVELRGPKVDQLRSYDVVVEAGQTFTVSVPPWEKPRVDDPVFDDGETDQERALREQARRKRILKGAFWTGVGVTAAAGAALASVGGVAVYSQRRWEELHCGGVPQAECQATRPDDPDLGPNGKYPLSHERRLDRFRTATNVMIGVTAALGVTTVVLGIFAFTKKKPSGANARVQVRAGGLTFRW